MNQKDFDALAEIFGSVKRTTIDGMRSEKSRLIALTVLHALQDRIIASFTPNWDVTWKPSITSVPDNDATLQDRLAELLAQGR